MDKLKQLIDLCKQRQQLFIPDFWGNGTLFNPYDMDESYQILTKQINRLAKALKIYNVSFYEHEISVGFNSFDMFKKFAGNEQITKTLSDYCGYRYSVSLFDGDLTLICYESELNDEEHKKAQAI